MGMAVDNGLECFGDVGGRIDVVELAGGDDRREQGPVFCPDFMTGEESVPCMQTVMVLQEFLDRELTMVEVTTVQGHLDRCPPCLNVYRFEERVRRLVRVHCVAECAPSDLKNQIMARLKRPAPRS